MDNTITVTFPAGRQAEAVERLAKLAKYAAKLGVPAPAYTISESFPVIKHEVRPDGSERSYTTICRTITIEVAPIVLPGGWTLLGTIHPTPEGNIVGAVPGKVIPSLYRERDGRTCDYCNTLRNRNETHIVQSEDGTIKQVGSTCVRDFLGGVSPEIVARCLSWAREIGSFASDFEGSFGGSYVESPDLLDTLTIAAFFVRSLGWVSGKDAQFDDRKTSTAAQVSWWRRPVIDKYDRERRAEFVAKFGKPTEADKATAEAAIAWSFDTFAGDEQTPENDYFANLRVIVRLGYVQPKFHGFAVSIVSAYLRAQDQLKAKARKADSQYVGEVGKRQVFEGLTVEGARAYESQFGVSTRIEFIDANGNVLVWWASNAPSVVVGEKLTVKATVKKQEEYKGCKQTTVTRATILAA